MMNKLTLVVAGLMVSFSMSSNGIQNPNLKSNKISETTQASKAHRLSDVVDVYGLDKQNSQRILSKYAKKVANIEEVFFENGLDDAEASKGSKEQKKMERALQQRMSLLEQIKRDNGYLFVDFQTVIYPSDDSLYTSIEIIDKSDPQRLRFVEPPTREASVKKANHTKPDLIDQMNEYIRVGMTMVINHQLSSKVTPCPVYHCVMGFDDPKLKPYLVLFNQGVVQQKAHIIDVLQHDPSPERRAGAAFLVGHFQDPQEIITRLMPSVSDQSADVRNNAMRVISETVDKMKDKQINLSPFIEALNSPYASDRNKAMLVILNALGSDSSKKIVLQQAGDKLLALMRMKQPNNHDTAYLILKKISDKSFSDKNLRAWERWVKKNMQPSLSA